MTDRYNAFIVILEQDIRKDDAEATIAAIKQIKGVADVKPHIADISDSIAYSRAFQTIWNALIKAMEKQAK